MDPAQINMILNLIAVVLGGGAMAAVLGYKTKMRSLALAAEEEIRKHFADEVKSLRGQLQGMEKHYREMLEASDKRHEECQLDRDRMRDRVKELENHVTGLEAQIRQLSTNAVLEIRGNPTGKEGPEAVDSAPRVQKIINENGAK